MQNRIKIERAIPDMTQADLAKKMGASRQSINAIENAKYVPSALLALKIARFFDKPVELIFFLEDNE